MAQELFTYDWHMDDAPAIFQVDMAVPTEALSCRPYMLYIQGKSRKEALTPREERHLAALFKKAEKTLDALFVGSIHAAARQVFFFYTDDAEQGSQAKALIAQEKVLDCTAGLRDDPAGDTYHKLLYPDAARLFTQQNRQQIDLLKKHGDALTPARRVAFHVFFPSEPLALRFTEDARQSGFAVGESEFAPEQELGYGISLLRIAPLDKGTIDQLTTCIIRLAAQYGGSLTYWNCPIMGKRR